MEPGQSASGQARRQTGLQTDLEGSQTGLQTDLEGRNTGPPTPCSEVELVGADEIRPLGLS